MRGDFVRRDPVMQTGRVDRPLGCRGVIGGSPTGVEACGKRLLVCRKQQVKGCYGMKYYHGMLQRG